MKFRFPADACGPACPACRSDATEVLFEVDGIPVHSCVLLDTAAAARAFPLGGMRLTACRSCGFLFNASFDPARLDYSEDYEETQGCSPTFRRWLDGVLVDLDERITLEGRTVLEVGCGRGDFLSLLCERLRCRGIGVDPSGTAGRAEAAEGTDVSYLRAELGPEHADLGADLVACRHTLEHIGPVLDFLELTHDVARGRDAALFVEVPETLRILREGAFWDVYYEHASYFTEGSLARLAARAGFAVDDVWTTYADQYVQIFARAASRPAGAEGCPDDCDEIAEAIAGFQSACEGTIAVFHALLSDVRARGERIALWGSGSKATAFLTTLDAADLVDAVVDINPAKHGRFVAGAGTEIVPPAALRDLAPQHVIVMNPIYVEEIGRDLAAMALSPQVHSLGAPPT
ncbi:MAG: class I SAM-dependent methyltransferase [Planctomycetota bacterium]